MRQVALQSSPAVNTPGLLRWAMNGYRFKRDRKNLRRVFVTGYGLPDPVVHRLLSGELPHQIVGEEVHFEYDATVV